MAIRLSTYCRCGGELIVSSSSLETALGIERLFKEEHDGDGHELFSDRVEAAQARRRAVSS
ncbi:hypothetical protein [Actinophytocola sp.]|uniref:hypothetical protein n=1 Tax=Actinophytocola sp. TaxID=1872138 RepID=UPI002D292943|nr:hypothetical protein [Actinophytocola sp.]HYQ69653.1 hypothetical protein [Actinophytocola sp.]